MDDVLWFLLVFFVGVIGLGIVGTKFASPKESYGYLRKMDVHEIVSSSSWVVSFGLCVFGLLFPFMPFALTILSPPKGPDILSCLQADGIALSLGLFFFVIAPIQEIHFDLDHGTYRYTQRLLFYQRVVEGSIQDDIAGIYLINGASNFVWAIRIAWKPTRGSGKVGLLKSTLERGMSQSYAEALAEKLSIALGVPVVSTPSQQW